MLTVWGRNDSSNVQAVMWCITELGLPVTRHDIGHRFGGTDTAEFRAMNPNGTVPVLADSAAPDMPPLWESGAILRYLAAQYGSDAFWPHDPARRADIDRWAEWAKVTVASEFGPPIFLRLVRTPAAERDMAAIAKAVTALGRRLRIADERLSRHPFLAGAELTLADIQFGHILYRYFTLPIERPDLPALAAYYQRLTQRPAYRDHVMVSYAALQV